MKQKISILGSTGSIGISTLNVVKAYPEMFEIIGLAANTNVEMLAEQVNNFHPKIVSVGTEKIAKRLKTMIDPEVKVYYGSEGLIEVSTLDDVDFVMNAVVGITGLLPTIEAIKAGKNIGLANKETLVAAGKIVTDLAKKHNCTLYPIDSEHSALFQCMQGERNESIETLILTASGGSFRDLSRNEMKEVSVSDALNHPNWNMGAKITIDSATLINKGFEVIEAHWFFEIPYDRIEVLYHPESIIHSMVQFIDGSIKAQIGVPDMSGPIQYALNYPIRLPSSLHRLNLSELGKLHFDKPDFLRFPCLKIAYEAGKEGGTATAVLNSANEIANELFRNGYIKFLDIEKIIISTLNKHINIGDPSLEEILDADRWARDTAKEIALSL